MRSWERKDIIDILIRHHAELREASHLENSFRGSDELDDDCIVIENYLEETWGIEWDGLRFIDSRKNLIS